MPRSTCQNRANSKQNTLVSEHLPLVRSIAARLWASLPSTFELDDLIAAGNVGLLKAAARYRPSDFNATPFSAYARLVIRGSILDSVRRGAYVEATRPSASALPDPVTVPDYDAELDGQDLRRRLAAAIAALPRRQARLIRLHYHGGQRLASIGPQLGVGKSRASQLHMEAVRALRLAVAGG